MAAGDAFYATVAAFGLQAAAVVLTVLLVGNGGGDYASSDVGTVFALQGGRR